MEDAVPGPGEEINLGQPTAARPAATVMLVRGGTERLEVLLVQRTPAARFMGGAWVFPGGAVDPGEGEGEEALRAAAIREVAEEAGITLTGPELIPFSRWITPNEVKIRFDTWFYVAAMPEGASPRIDRREVVDWRWYRPGEALEAGQREELLLVFPTIKHLEQLAGFQSAQALIDHARGRQVQPVQPRVIVTGEVARIVLPGEPGYDD
jgi:8-oxo-dGTP pyrophosphatase MutT (NUDIX family)